MYEYLKNLLPVAELVGEPREINLYSADPIMGDRACIKGLAEDGRQFSLILKIEEAKPDAQ